MSEEQPKAVADEVQATKKARIDSTPIGTLCLSCRGLHNDYQLRHWLLYDNRTALGIEDWFREGKEGGAPASMLESAPLVSLYVSFSRKPYFLIESSSEEFKSKLIALFTPTAPEPFLFKEHQVSVVPSLPGVTVASQREKVQAVEDKEKAKAAVEKKAAPLPPKIENSAPTKMVPRSVMRRK